MKTIGVISDTHGLLRDEALDALEGSDLILHAGDVGEGAILERLAAVAPVVAVHGNTDHGALRHRLPSTALVDLGSPDGSVPPSGPTGPVAYMLHIEEDLDLDPPTAGVSMVVTGHTHRPEIRRDRTGVIFLNPGAAGHRRFDLPVTVARVRLEGTSITPEIVEILP